MYVCFGSSEQENTEQRKFQRVLGNGWVPWLAWDVELIFLGVISWLLLDNKIQFCSAHSEFIVPFSMHKHQLNINQITKYNLISEFNWSLFGKMKVFSSVYCVHCGLANL